MNEAVKNWDAHDFLYNVKLGVLVYNKNNDNKIDNDNNNNNNNDSNKLQFSGKCKFTPVEPSKPTSLI